MRRVGERCGGGAGVGPEGGGVWELGRWGAKWGKVGMRQGGGDVGGPGRLSAMLWEEAGMRPGGSGVRTLGTSDAKLWGEAGMSPRGN